MLARWACWVKGVFGGWVFLPISTLILGTGAVIQWLWQGRQPGAFDPWIFRWAVSILRFWGLQVKVEVWDPSGNPPLRQVCQLRSWRDFENFKAREKDFFVAPLVLFKHGSFLDIFVLFALCPRLRFGAKIELFRIPFLGFFMKASGTVALDRSNRQQAIGALVRALKQVGLRHPLALAPEGRRVPEDQVYPFKSGPFYLMAENGLQAQGVLIYQSRRLWPPGHLWPRGVCDVRERLVHVVILPVLKSERRDKEGYQQAWFEQFQAAWDLLVKNT